MKRSFLLLSIFTVLLLALVGIMKFQSEAVSKRNSGVSQEQEPKWESVKRVFNKGSIQNDVFRVTFPRSDLQIKVDDVQIDPNLALTSYLAFKQVGNHSMMMGDLVYTTISSKKIQKSCIYMLLVTVTQLIWLKK